ncbi:hypothetical protein NLG97_g7081 [Lecanicillium saksenae]|uniref:Uncharacterized protein n=1 Tax=Lecanicillium saksenae TaxID=468837 RepID=A0ACC1QP38_9HYPO|nr:hypothetical protein NLG97_g7081 [Lecanicillium saksenae]
MCDTPASLIAELAKYDDHSLTSNTEVRKSALALSRKLSAALDEPNTRAWEAALSPFSNLAIRIAIDLNLFTLLAMQPGPVSSSFLTSTTTRDPALIRRILRVLGSIGFVQETSSDSWSPNAVTHAMTSSTMASWYRLMWDFALTSAVKGPECLRSSSHRISEDLIDGFVQCAFGSSRNSFSILQTMPALHHDFDEAMAGTGTGQGEPWFVWYPVEERLLTGLENSAPLLVDVGGGKGHEIQAFCRAFPSRGQLVLQDMADVIDNVGSDSLDPEIAKQSHDFFTSQPVHGARAYFLRHILHDWPDSACHRILKGLRDAMRPGYSRLLLHELVLPDTGATRFQCEMDMCMMTFNWGLERSRSQWVTLLTEAGFESVTFWQGHPDSDGIIEAIIGSE